MTTHFKVGDMVKVVKDTCLLPLGHVTQILDISFDGKEVLVERPVTDGVYYGRDWYGPERFELVEPAVIEVYNKITKDSEMKTPFEIEVDDYEWPDEADFIEDDYSTNELIAILLKEQTYQERIEFAAKLACELGADTTFVADVIENLSDELLS